MRTLTGAGGSAAHGQPEQPGSSGRGRAVAVAGLAVGVALTAALAVAGCSGTSSAAHPSQPASGSAAPGDAVPTGADSQLYSPYTLPPFTLDSDLLPTDPNSFLHIDPSLLLPQSPINICMTMPAGGGDATPDVVCSTLGGVG